LRKKYLLSYFTILSFVFLSSLRADAPSFDTDQEELTVDALSETPDDEEGIPVTEGSQERVKSNGDYLTRIDRIINSENKIIIMEREKNNFIPKGQLYSHSCPNCGGVLDDTDNENCPYCGSVVKSSKYEWIITDILNVENYLKSFEDKVDKNIEKNIQNIEIGFTFNEIVLNNVLIILASDNNITLRNSNLH